jgi:hypothetical protein
MTLEPLQVKALDKIAVFAGKMVDVTGIEPVTPCLQSNPRNTMWLILLAFTYVT